MKITIEFPSGPRTYNADWLEAVRLVASATGFVDVDVEELPDRVIITAFGPSSSNKRESASGGDLAEACSKFCERVSKS